ncbi:MAG: hypothetical protein MRZ94_08630 [Oscillospiraceae bacterium]|nr:hypothetical protein [Oscillospiraceae bacterium]MDY2510030.1 hypothetical protein [Ruminococcus callidus]
MEETQKQLNPKEAEVKIYTPQAKTFPVRQQTGFLDHAPVRIYEKPVKQESSFPPAFQ